MTAAIELSGVCKTSRGTRILREVDLEVEPGTMFGLIGQSGAGKTSTLSILLGLRRASRGAARILGVDSSRLHRLAGRIGVALDRPPLEGALSVQQNLRLHAVRHGRRATGAADVLDALDLGGLASRRASRLSQGEQQRLGLGLALLLEPEVLVLDEPLAHLDPGLARSVSDLLSDVVRDRGCTVLLSSHQLFHVERSAQALALIHRGRILLSGSLPQLLAAHGTVLWVRGSPGDRLQRVLEDHPLVASMESEQQAAERGARPPLAFRGEADGARLVRAELREERPAEVNAALCAAGVEVSLLQPHRPSLDDLFHEAVARADREISS